MSILFLERVGRKQSRRGGDKSRVSLCGPNCCRNLLGTGHLSRDRCATYDTYGQIYRKSYHGNVQRTENSCVEERSLEACKGPGYGVRVRDHCHGEAGTNSGKQSHDERLLSEPASVQSEKERGQ